MPRRRVHFRVLLALLGASLCLLGGTAATASTKAVATLQVVGSETTVFNWNTDRCATWNIPDLPLRAFRDSRGVVHAVLSHFTNYALVGPDLDHLKPDCSAPLQTSDGNADPATFDDKRWIAAPYTLDGKTIYALEHVEYQGNTHPGMCPSQTYMSCWYNSIQLATSSNGGTSFSTAASPLVATMPTRYVPDGGNIGIFQPSNIVRSPLDGAYYAMALEIGPGNSPRGSCLMRSTDLADPQSWRGWDGSGFSVSFVDPYHDSSTAGHVCQPVATPQISEMTQSLTYNTTLQQFLLVGDAGQWDPQSKSVVWGIYYSVSPDLIHWSQRQVLDVVTPTWAYQCGGEDPGLYPSLLDPSSTSRNFETTGSTAYLYYTRFHYVNCKMTPDRDLVRVPVTIGTGA
jgi:hypothetical protein